METGGAGGNDTVRTNEQGMTDIPGAGGSAIWTIGPLESFHDNFANPADAGEGTRHIEKGMLASGERWPLYHASEADPDGGYRVYSYGLEFDLDPVPETGVRLEVGMIANTPRLAYLDVELNGLHGNLFFRPSPSTDAVIKPKHCLHASIYSKDRGTIFFPAEALRRRKNIVSFTARDDEPFLRVDNLQAVKRLDRMADACGFIYEELSLHVPDERPRFECAVVPSPLYRRMSGTDGSASAGSIALLYERCTLQYTARAVAPGAVLLLRFEAGDRVFEYELDSSRRYGWSKSDFYVPEGTGSVGYAVLERTPGKSGAERTLSEGTFSRCRKWTVYATPHAHTDIGYTHRQWEVAERQARIIDAALETMKTAGNSFAFILDSSWPLEEYLASRDEGRKTELLERVGEGKLGIPANYVDLLSQFAGLEDLIRNGEFTESVLRGSGLSADRVDMVDVASAPSSFPTILAGMGVKYFFHANNQDRGPFRLNGGLHRKSPFYWEGPDGSRILVWLSRMYCELKKVCGSPPGIVAAERGLTMWLRDYERNDYAPDAVVLYGQEADNTDLDPRAVDFVRDWNETWEYPRIVPCDGSTFFRAVEDKFSASFPTYRGDGGAYWEDGAASSFEASADVRRAQALLKSAEILESLAVIHGRGRRFDAERFRETWKDVLLYDEHTWGAFLSDADYGALLQQDQWEVKRHMAQRSLRGAERLLHAAAVKCSLEWNNAGREVVVHNPTDADIPGTARVEIGLGEEVFDAGGDRVPCRVISSTATQKLVELYLGSVPPFSWIRLPLRETGTSGARTVELECPAVFESPYYRVRFDFGRGAIASAVDRESGREIVGNGRFLAGEFLYVAGGEGSGLLGNHSDKAPSRVEPAASFRYVSRHAERTAFGTSVVVSGKVPHGSLEAEFFIHDRTKRIDIAYRYDKEEVLSPEAVYVAFPFALPEKSRVYSDSHVGWVDWNTGSLPGACKEWLPLQTSILVRGGEYDVQIASPDAFLFTVNDIVRGRWPRELDLSGNTVFSYVLNNYWKTNYKAAQGGTLRFRYSLFSGREIRFEDAFRRGARERTGLYAHRMSYQEFRSDVPAVYADPAGGTFAEAASDHISVSTITKARWSDGFIVRFVETGGRPGTGELSLPGIPVARAFLVDHLERLRHELPVENGTVRADIRPWEIVSVRFEPGRKEA